MTRLILVRHGQSVANAENRFAGHSDFDLTELGKQQANLAAEYLYTREKPDVIYSSDLLRAHNTALPFAQKYGMEIHDTEELREIYAGEWEGLELREIAERYTEDLIRWRDDFSNARCTGGESVAEVYHRIRDTLLKLARKHDGQCLLIATHATVVRSAECFARGFGAERMADVPFVRNSAINIFECDGERLTPIRTDIVEHLDPSLVTAVPNSLKN